MMASYQSSPTIVRPAMGHRNPWNLSRLLIKAHFDLYSSVVFCKFKFILREKVNFETSTGQSRLFF